MPDGPSVEEIRAALRDMGNDFKQAPVGQPDDQLEGLDDTQYQARIDSFDMFPGKKDPSALYLKTTVSIQNDSQHAGRALDRLDNLRDRDKLRWFKEHMSNCGVDVTQHELDEFYPGSEVCNGLLDKWVLIEIYTNKKGYRNWTVRQRLDYSDLGTAQEQIEGFEQNTESGRAAPAPARTQPSQAQLAANLEGQLNKPDNCICPDPRNGAFDGSCPVPGHSDEPDF